MRRFADRLLGWYDTHGRKDLPWQQHAGAYGIWVSEIMLQQTQVRTVIPYYRRFMSCFPDVESLADAPIDEVLRRWSGLGYYARARNLHAAAQKIRDNYGGVFPCAFNDVVDLPGIGRSTAGAILSLAFDERHAILDGNVKRVLARHQGIAGWPGKTSVGKVLWAAAEVTTPEERIADYTQAIMDLGATVCVRNKPHCARCPVQSDCKARTTGTISLFPGRKPRRDKPLKQTTMLLAVSENAVYLERRPAAGIWGGLWSFPEVAADEIDTWCRRVLNDTETDRDTWGTLRHSFSHFDLDIQPVVVRTANASRTVVDTEAAAWAVLDHQLPGGVAAPVQTLIDLLKKEHHVTNC